MAYIITRTNKTGYVQLVEKARVNGESRTVGYICGLGTMSHEDFKRFQGWAHSMTDQEMRKQRVLACPLVAVEKERAETKVASIKQKKTTVKKPPKVKTVDKKKSTKSRVEREKAWYQALPEEEKERYKAKQKGRIFVQTKELKERFKVFGKVKAKEHPGIQFVTIKKPEEKIKIIDERIEQLEYKIANARSEIRTWEKGRGVAGKAKAGAWKIENAKEGIQKYEGAIKILKRQKAGLQK